MKIIVHKDNDLEIYYLVDENGKVLANTGYAADLFTDKMNDEIARNQRLDLARRRLLQELLYYTDVFYDDSKECKEFLIEMKKNQIKEDFDD